MRPYLAILRDSVREAMTARTLPVLLVFFTVVLAALAPIGLEETTSWKLSFYDITNRPLFLAKLRPQADGEGDTPASRVLERLPERLKKARGLIESTEDESNENRHGTTPKGTEESPVANADDGNQSELLVPRTNLVEAINTGVLPDATFYDAAAWSHINLPEEAERLLEKPREELSADEVKRLNRLLLSAAFPGALRPPLAEQMTISYAGYAMPAGSLPPIYRDPEMVRVLARQILYLLCVWGIGPIGLLISIVVTADIMPRTFEPGTIDLLLSKPVSRTLVFLTKFFGACAFVLISFGYLVAGLWLIFGFRLGIWSAQLWGVVPLFIFTFAVIYSVSAVVGLRYRSAIVAVFAAVLVWGAAFCLGVTLGFFTAFRERARVEAILPLEDTVLVATSAATAYLWNGDEEDWSIVGAGWPARSGRPVPMLQSRILGPLYDAEKDRVIAANVGMGGSAELQIATAERGWQTIPGARMPPGTQELFLADDGRLFAAGLAGLFEFHGDPTIPKEEFNLFGIYDLIPKDPKNSFARVDDLDGLWGEGMDVALGNSSRQAVVYRQGRVTLLKRDRQDEFFEKATSRQLVPPKEAEAGLLAMTEEAIVVVEKSGKVHLLDSQTLKSRETFSPRGEAIPQRVIANPAGTIVAILFHDGYLWLYDLKDQRPIDEDPAGQGDLTAVAFGPQGNLWVADRLRRVQTYKQPGMTLLGSREGSLDMIERIYRYGLKPLSYLLPDTYGLRDVYEYLFTDETSEAMNGQHADLEGQRRELEIAEPLIHNALFLCVVLGLASWYVSRKDF